MKTRKIIQLACLIMTGVVLMSGCNSQVSGSQNQKTTAAVPSSKAAEKKSDYELSRVKFYDADGICTIDVSYEYNEEGKEVHRVQQNFGQFEWTDESFYTYPDALTRQQTYIDKDTGVRNQVDTTVYDESGNIQTETSTDYRADGSSNIMSRKEYTYDKDGNLTLKEEHSTATVGHELNHISKTEYTYDNAGNRLTEKLTSSSVGGEEKVFTDLEYQYDSKGNKIRKISHIADEHTYSPILYEYNNKSQMIKETDYTSTSPDTVKRYYIFEYDENGNKKKYTCYSPEDLLISYAEYEYIKIGDLVSKEKTTYGKDELYKTWSVDGTASSTISFQFIDPATGIRCEIKNYDIRVQQEGVGGMSTSVEATDSTIEINSGPEEYTNLTYWFEADGTLKLKDESTGNTISLRAQ